MGVREWFAGFRPGPTLRKSYRQDLRDDRLEDIGNLTIDYFWQRCEQYLPDDWLLALVAFPDPHQPGRLLYRAQAHLVDPDMDAVPGMIPDARTTPLRAIETLFYGLREL